MRHLELLDRCKAVIDWCVLGVVVVRTLNALERDYAARVRHGQRDYHASVRPQGLLDRCEAMINGCVLSIVVVRTLSALERDYTARVRRAGRPDVSLP